MFKKIEQFCLFKIKHIIIKYFFINQTQLYLIVD